MQAKAAVSQRPSNFLLPVFIFDQGKSKVVKA
jgi:hypothetical protein